MGRVKRLSKKRLEFLKKARAAAEVQRNLRRRGIPIQKDNFYSKGGSSGGEEVGESIYKVEVKQEVNSDEEERLVNTFSPTLAPSVSSKVLPTIIKVTSWAPQQQQQSHQKMKRVPDLTPPPTHCLLCYQNMSFKKLRPVISNNVAEANFNAMFILKKMLQVPKHRLEEYLRTFGNPNEWILICRPCLALVNQSLKIEKEINELEITLCKYQEEMVNKIRSTWSAKTEQSVSSMFIKKASPITNEVRSFVYNNTDKPSQKISHKFPTNPIINTCWEKEEIRALSPKTSSPGPVASTYNSDSSWEWESTEEWDEETIDPPPATATSHCLLPRSPVKTNLLPTNVNTKRRNVMPTYFDLYRERNFRCPQCPNVKISSLDQFISHAIFHYRRPLKCSYCFLYYSNAEKLGTNSLPTSSIANVSPDDTDRHICSWETLEKAPVFQVGKLWKCDWCPSLFDLEDERDSHEKHCTNWKLKAKTHDKPEIELKYKCATCSKQYRSLSERWIHRALVHPEATAQSCLYCDEVFIIQTKDGIDIPDFEALKYHMINKHPLIKRVVQLPDTCDLCGSIFLDRLSLLRHMTRVHELPKSSAFSCDICHFRSETKSCLRKHVIAIHKDDPNPKKFMICDICGFKWTQGYEKQLLNHKLTKHGIEPACTGTTIYSCDKQDCGGFRTVYKKFLETHMMKHHEAERKFKCKVCAKGFFYSTKLRVHEEIHQNATLKPYQCEICGNSFAVQNYLYIHMRLSHENRPFASTNKRRVRPSTSNRKKQVSSDNLISHPTPTFVSNSGTNPAKDANTNYQADSCENEINY